MGSREGEGLSIVPLLAVLLAALPLTFAASAYDPFLLPQFALLVGGTGLLAGLTLARVARGRLRPELHGTDVAAIEKARRNREGAPAAYIPELANVPLEVTSAAVTLVDGTVIQAGDVYAPPFTFQSAAKLITLAGLLEERGPVEVFATVGSEPSGDAFASVARLETHDPKPANPLINSGAIALCDQVNGIADAPPQVKQIASQTKAKAAMAKAQKK